MNIKSALNVVTRGFGRRVLLAQKVSPTVLFAAGVAGVVGTVVLASRATLKMDGILTEAQSDLEKAAGLEHANYSEKDRQQDTIHIYVRTAVKIATAYGPAVIVGALSIAALTGSHVVLSRRNVAITAAYAALDRGFREYRSRVIDKYGHDKDNEFRLGLVAREIIEETAQGPVVKKVKDLVTNGVSIYGVCFDQTNPNYNPQAHYNAMFLRCQQQYANDLLQARGHVFLNEVHDMLGVPRTKEGAVVGWVRGNGDNYVDFGVLDGNADQVSRFVNGAERSVWLDFNVDGLIYDKI